MNLSEKKKVKASNQSLVYGVFGEDEKLTVREVAERVNLGLRENGPHERISEATVRRAVSDLEKLGSLKSYGRQNNAFLYGKPTAALFDSDRKLIPYAGELKDVEDFIRIITNPKERPFTRNTAVMGEKMQHNVRRQLAYVVMSSIDAGFSQQVRDVNTTLHKLVEDLAYVHSVLEGFLNSPVWYPQYRDQMAVAVREMQKNDPELFQLALDYIKSGE